MKLWLDDVRIPPDGTYFWCKTAPEAIAWLKSQIINPELVSLDFDLGPVETCGTGMDVVKFLIEEYTTEEEGIFECWGPPIRIHSQNPVGAQQMRNALLDADFTVL